jgi:XTP/dITP diphosphohydrolase
VTEGAFELVLASANPHKVGEIVAILDAALGPNVTLLPRPTEVPEIDESGTTLLANARIKARTIAQATHKAAVADDTGLEVDALGGAPGVYSARYAGEEASYADNVEKLLVTMRDVSDRAARFRTVAIVVFPDDSELVAEGVTEGSIASSPVGDGGFGYDSVFYPVGSTRTYAELSAQEKHAISHRGKAFRQLASRLHRRVE